MIGVVWGRAGVISSVRKYRVPYFLNLSDLFTKYRTDFSC